MAAVLSRPALVVSSPLRRARDTAAAFGLPVAGRRTLDGARLRRARRPGSSGRTRATCGNAGEPTIAFVPDGGESLRRSGRGSDRPAMRWRRRCATSTVVVVTHVSPIKAAIAWALDVPDGIAWHMYVEDAGVSPDRHRRPRTHRALVQPWSGTSPERGEERPRSVRPTSAATVPATGAAVRSSPAPPVVGRQTAQRRGQCVDVAGIDEASLAPVRDEVRQVAGSPADRGQTGGQRLAVDRAVGLGVARAARRHPRRRRDGPSRRRHGSVDDDATGEIGAHQAGPNQRP